MTRILTLLTLLLMACPLAAAPTLPRHLGAKRLFVCPTLTDGQLKRSPYVFRTLEEAARHLTPGTGPDDRMTILLAPAVYWLDDPDDPRTRTGEHGRPPIALTIRCPWLSIVGLGEKPDDVVLASNRGQTQGAVGNFTMLSFHGDGLHLENLTLGNYCNVDLDYPRDPSQNRPRRAEAICQAQLAFADGDRLTAQDCRFISRLNTCPLNGGRRTLFTRCYFEMTDDALEGRAVYRQCTFRFFSSKPFYATSRAGAVIVDSDILIESSANDAGNVRSQYLTKVSSPIILADCRFRCHGEVKLDWTPYPDDILRCYQHNLTLNSRPADIKGGIRLEGTPLLNSIRQCAQLTADNLFTMLDTLAIHTELLPQRLTATGDTTVSFRVRRFALGDRQLSDTKLPQQYLINNGDTTKTISIDHTDPSGLQAAAVVSMEPTPLPPPTVKGLPEIKKAGEGTLTIDYELDTGGLPDESLVTWYRCDNEEGANALAVAVSRHFRPERTYRLQPGDAGHYIMATLQPRHRRSRKQTATATSALWKTIITENDIATPWQMETDFSHLPTQPQPRLLPGTWTLDGYKPADTAAQQWEAQADSWTYGPGIDGAHGEGLLQKAKGARLFYLPATPHQPSTMSVCWNMDPCKTAGQGFGSATDQYLDVYIHFDPSTLTGYALRIVRTPKYANAVDMLLVGYDHGKVKALTEPVATTCFLTGCTVRLCTTPADGQRLLLSADVSTSTPQRHSQLAKEVHLTTLIPPQQHHAIGLQHTGSVGANAIMLHSVKAEWKERGE